ncbi:MAG TPA: hypothetical protein VE031_07625 [Chthoniobacterales bacterium]|nr:hypothetical protein [Chthoniobacterales bacterium]
MSFYEFSHDVVPVLQLCLTAVGLTSLFLIWWQAKRTTRWNQAQSHHQFFKDTPNPTHERAAHDAAKKIGVNINDPLDDQAVKKIVADDDALFAARNLLNDYEELCSAVEIGTLSEDVAFAVDSARLVRVYKIFKPFIEFWREEKDDREAWIGIQKLALEWETRELEFREKKQRAFAKLEQHLAKLEKKVAAKRSVR